MPSKNNLTKKIGIIGGGQLAKMLAQKAIEMGLMVNILDPDPQACAAGLATQKITGQFDDLVSLEKLASISDVTTYDLEHIDTTALKKLETHGHKIFPSAALLETVQDKWKQKKFYQDNQIPCARGAMTTKGTLPTDWNYPIIVKSRTGGYDGQGVLKMTTSSDWTHVKFENFFIEECVEIDKELSVMVAGFPDGQVVAWPMVEMTFNPARNILDTLLAPASVSTELAQQGIKLACDVAQKIGLIGVCGVELFLTKSGKLLVNEIAPRPHNSGHHTIEACATSQYEQHLRAILGWPAGSTDQITPAVMFNLLGEPDANGLPQVTNLESVLKIAGLHLHWYGKKEVRPHRKMGHITVTATTLEEAMQRAEQAKSLIKIIGTP